MEVLSMSSPQKNVVGLPASIVEIHGEKGHHGFSQKKMAVWMGINDDQPVDGMGYSTFSSYIL